MYCIYHRYVSDLLKPPFVATSIKPTDCGEDFLALSENIFGNGQFIAWLSNSRRLITLNSGEAGIELFLRQKEWEIATIHPILEVSHVLDYTGNDNSIKFKTVSFTIIQLLM